MWPHLCRSPPVKPPLPFPQSNCQNVCLLISLPLFYLFVYVCVCWGGNPRTCVGKLVEARQVNVGVFFSLSPCCFLRRLLTEPETHSVGWSSYWPVSPRILLSPLCCAGITGTSSCQLLPVCSGDSEEGPCKGRAVSSTLLAPVTLSACSKGA